MNRRKFLQSMAVMAALSKLPKIELPKFDKWTAEPTRPMTKADLEKGIEIMGRGVPANFGISDSYIEMRVAMALGFSPTQWSEIPQKDRDSMLALYYVTGASGNEIWAREGHKWA